MAQTHPNVDSCDAGPPDCQSMGNSSVDSWTDSTASLLFFEFSTDRKVWKMTDQSVHWTDV